VAVIINKNKQTSGPCLHIKLVKQTNKQKNTDGRTDFTGGHFSPNPLARFCKLFCQLKLSNPSKLIISKKIEIKDLFTRKFTWGLFSDGL